MRIKKYKKEYEYSYALGASPSIELLENRPQDCMRVYYSPDYQDKDNKIRNLCELDNISFEENQKIINILSPKENCYVIAAFYKREYKLEKAKSHVILDNPSDMGNIGTIIRSCAGFGVNNLALIKGADAYNPKAVRASMGAFFHVNLEYFASIQDYIKAHGEGRELYAFMLNADNNLTDICAGDKIYTLIFGNESSGLDYNIYKDIASVSIKQTDAVDSLSLPIAVSIALFWMGR